MSIDCPPGTTTSIQGNTFGCCGGHSFPIAPGQQLPAHLGEETILTCPACQARHFITRIGAGGTQNEFDPPEHVTPAKLANRITQLASHVLAMLS
jgi:hypothetical protein